jgi:hypothetical protein
VDVSTFNGKLMDAVPLGAHATAHDTVEPTSVYVCETHPVVDTGTGSTCHVTVTGLVCQAPDWSHPPVAGPGLHVTDSVLANAVEPKHSPSATTIVTVNHLMPPTP